MKKIYVVIALMMLFASSLTFMSTSVSAGNINNCVVSGQRPTGTLTDVDNHPYSVKARGTISCNYAIDYEMTVYVGKVDPAPNAWPVIGGTYNGTVPKYDLDGHDIYSGCLPGSGTYKTIVTVTDVDTGQSKTWTSANTTLSLTCQTWSADPASIYRTEVQ